MKVTDTILNFFGSDKIIHFLVSMNLMLLMCPSKSFVLNLIVAIVILFIGYYKEKKLDDVFDEKDFIADCIGVFCGFIYDALWVI